MPLSVVIIYSLFFLRKSVKNTNISLLSVSFQVPVSSYLYDAFLLLVCTYRISDNIRYDLLLYFYYTSQNIYNIYMVSACPLPLFITSFLNKYFHINGRFHNRFFLFLLQFLHNLVPCLTKLLFSQYRHLYIFLLCLECYNS